MVIENRRSMQRFNLRVPVSIHSKCQNLGLIKKEYITTNICAGGAYFITENALPIGTEVGIDLPWPPTHLKWIDNKERLFKITGAVVRSDPRGMAIAFNSVFQLGRVE